MNLQQIKKINAQKGFTIVELLIVIVVIGILAAIVIVAYNGVQNSARDSNNKTDAVSLAKVAEAINADKGWYPGGTGDAAVTSTATLLTSFGQSSTAKLPSGVTVTYLASSGTAPTESAAETAANASPHSYTVKVCGGTNGLVIYYPGRAPNAIQSVNAGSGC